MTYYAPNNQKDLEKLKNLIEQKKDIKKLRLNRKIQKETLNQDLAKIYAPITKNQQEQTKIIKEGQENQLKSIQDQTDQIKAITFCIKKVPKQIVENTILKLTDNNPELFRNICQNYYNPLSSYVDMKLYDYEDFPLSGLREIK